MKRVPLSVLDQTPIRQGGSAEQALQETLTLAQHAEALGYRRFWVSEHHALDGLAGVAPEVLLAALGARTQRIRLGSGGVMLPHYSPYKVAECFNLLAALYPGRIDLGVGRAPGGDGITGQALAYGRRLGPEHFPQQVEDLQAWLSGQRARTFPSASAMPKANAPAALWMLGSSPDSARLAGQMGLPYSVAQFINPQVPEDIFERYRQQFRPGLIAQPYSALGVFVLCAATEEEARYLAGSRRLWYLQLAANPGGGQLPDPREAAAYSYSAQELAYLDHFNPSVIVGNPQQVCAQLDRLVERFGADELVISSVAWDFQARQRSYQLLAQAWGLEPLSDE